MRGREGAGLGGVGLVLRGYGSKLAQVGEFETSLSCTSKVHACPGYIVRLSRYYAMRAGPGEESCLSITRKTRSL